VSRSAMPRHEAVERHLRMRIAGLRPGDPIESDAELCELFQVSRMTVRQATQRLVAEGAIYRVSGVGTFVGEPQVHRQMGRLRSFTEEMALRGMSASSKVIAAELRRGSKDEVAALRLAPRSKVVHLRRLRLAAGEPMAIEDVVLPPFCSWILDVDMANGSLHQALTEHGYAPARATGTQVASLATDEEAALLDLPRGAPLFVEQRVVTTEDGSPIERTDSRYAGTRFVFHIELTQ
jgi:GntR family transcriptional regulator